MDARNTVSQKFVRLLNDVGQGAVIVMLRGQGAAVSKAAPFLASTFRVVTFTVDSSQPAVEVAGEITGALRSHGISEAMIVADPDVAIAALHMAKANAALVRSMALVAPPMFDNDVAGGLAEFKTPVLVLFGTRDTSRPADAGQRIRRAIPSSSLMYVYDADCALDDERPEAVAAALQEFAIKREKFIVTSKSGRLYP